MRGLSKAAQMHVPSNNGFQGARLKPSVTWQMHNPVLSRWVARLSGWKHTLISSFLFVIAAFVLLRKSGISFQASDIGAWFLAGFCILFAIFVGVWSEIAYPWFQIRPQGLGYMLLFVLMLFSIFSFPASFTYVL
jgi:hypothetical protein